MRNNNDRFRMWHILYPILAYAGIYYLVEIAGMILMFIYSVLTMKASGQVLELNGIADLMVQMLTAIEYEMSSLAALISIPVSAAFLRGDRKRFEGYRYRYHMTPVWTLILAVFLGMAGCLAFNNMLNISGIMEIDAASIEQISSVMYQGRIWIELLGVGIISPIAEELVFRGLVMERIRDYTGPTMAILFSALIFGVYHGSMLQAVYAGALGLIFGYLYERYRNLAAPILAHMAANIISVLGTETNVLDPMYKTDQLLFVTTGIWCILVIVCLGIIQKAVYPRIILRDNAAHSEEHWQ